MTAQTKPTIITIFGGSGDLARLKLFPAIYSLFISGKLHEDTLIVGYARSQKTVEEFRLNFAQSIFAKFGSNVDEELLGRILTRVHYFSGQYDKISDFEAYRYFCSNILGEPVSNATHIAYFSVPPNAFQSIVEGIASSRVSRDEDIRLVLEKPFGTDTNSSRQLYRRITKHFKESQIFLLDHYLGKNIIESIVSLRRSNRVLNNILRGSEIANIQIHAIEDFGVKERLGYFDQVGIIKDFIQSHILQILSLMTMSIPMSREAEALHREKFTILAAIKFIPAESNISLGQYLGYRSLNKKVENSQTETFAALKLQIDREDWHNVPIYIRTGKQLNRSATYIVVEFKKFDFQDINCPTDKVVLELKPSEKLHVKFVNVNHDKVQSIDLSANFDCSEDVCLGEHEQLIYEVIMNEQINFLSFSEILASWEIIDNVKNFVNETGLIPEKYKEKSFGPESSDSIIQKDGFKWFEL